MLAKTILSPTIERGFYNRWNRVTGNSNKKCVLESLYVYDTCFTIFSVLRPVLSYSNFEKNSYWTFTRLAFPCLLSKDRFKTLGSKIFFAWTHFTYIYYKGTYTTNKHRSQPDNKFFTVIYTTYLNYTTIVFVQLIRRYGNKFFCQFCRFFIATCLTHFFVMCKRCLNPPSSSDTISHAFFYRNSIVLGGTYNNRAISLLYVMPFPVYSYTRVSSGALQRDVIPLSPNDYHLYYI